MRIWYDLAFDFVVVVVVVRLIFEFTDEFCNMGRVKLIINKLHFGIYESLN